MNYKFNLWRARCLFEGLDTSFECVMCNTIVEHPLLHYIRYHREHFPRVKRCVEFLQYDVWNFFNDIKYELYVSLTIRKIKIKRWIKRHKVKPKWVKWEELLALEREVVA